MRGAVRGPDSSRAGVALVVTLLLLLVLTFTGAAALALGLQERSVAWSDTRLSQARFAAETGVRQASQALMTAVDSAAPGPEWPQGATWNGEVGSVADYRVELLPIDAEHALLEGTGRSPSGAEGGVSHRAGRVLWRPDLERRLQSQEAILVHGGDYSATEPAGVAEDSVADPEWLEPGGPGGEACDPYRTQVHDALDGRSPPLRHRPGPEARAFDGAPPFGRRDGRGFRDVAGRMEELAPPMESGNGGEGADPEDGSASLPLWYAPDGAVLDDGVVEGIVWVRGDLVLGGTARVDGLVLVDGGLWAAGEAEIRGHVRVAGHVEMEGQAVIRGSGCALVRALDLTDGALAPAPLADGDWVSLPGSG